MRRPAVLTSMLMLAIGLALPAPAQGETPVSIANSRFEPRDITVARGDTVVWTNNDAAGHSVTADDGSFDSNPRCGMIGGTCMSKGENFSATFAQPGKFTYHCRNHGAPGGKGMAGTVTVT